MQQLKAKIIKNEKIAPGFYKMRVESSYLAEKSQPGQFIEVKCSDGLNPLLRRPLGVHRVVKNGIELLYEVVGEGTGLLSKMKPKSMLDVIGPLGHGFDIITLRNVAAILVAGGNGVAPLIFLAETLIAKKQKVSVLIGGCSQTHILCTEELKKMGAKVLIATEDGSRGHKGLVTGLLSSILRTMHYALCNMQIYACGPTGMLKAVAQIAKSKKIPCQVSLEERMACGVGVCLGCPVKVFKPNVHRPTQYEYKMVCKDGPVFNAKEIAW